MDQGGYNSGWKSSIRNEEFQEEDIWCGNGNGLKEKEVFDSTKDMSYMETCSNFTSRGFPSPATMIPRTAHGKPTPETKQVQHSAPVSVPDWSKIYGKKKNSKVVSGNGSCLYDDNRNESAADDMIGGGWDRDSDSDEGNVIPPHEWLANRLARNHISSFSVCEGAGRTLKGRDLCKVRNAVLSKTGFLE